MTTFVGPSLDTESGIGALTLGGFLAETASRHRDREAIVAWDPLEGRSARWTYGRVETEARRIARALIAWGLAKGGRVAVLMGNRPEWVASAFGVAMAGGVLVPLNTYLEAPELRYVLDHSGTAFLLLQPALAGHDYLSFVEDLCPRLPSDELPYLRKIACLESPSWQAFVAGADSVTSSTLDACQRGVSPHDEAVLIYTSGSTAKPKGVLHSHRAPTLQSWRFARQLCLDDSVRAWSAFPFFWTAGFCMVMGATLAAGGCLVVQEQFEPGAALWLLEEEKVTSPHAWPHQLASMESHPDWLHRDLSSLRHIDPATAFWRHPATHPPGIWSPRAAYGLTETFTIVSSLPADTPLDERNDSQGAILPGNSVRILSPETGEPLSVGAVGEIAVKGPTLMRGYLKVAPESSLDEDGFFHTGDAGYVDEHNYLHWTGRTSDMIKTGGANVSPVEIEEVLLYCPELVVARAVGVPDDTLGEIVVVCAVARQGMKVTEDTVREFLRGRIASYKIPRRVLFFDESELALTSNEKLRVSDLRDLATERLAGQ